jgi:hypothetical protein
VATLRHSIIINQMGFTLKVFDFYKERNCYINMYILLILQRLHCLKTALKFK